MLATEWPPNSMLPFLQEYIIAWCSFIANIFIVALSVAFRGWNLSVVPSGLRKLVHRTEKWRSLSLMSLMSNGFHWVPSSSIWGLLLSTLLLSVSKRTIFKWWIFSLILLSQWIPEISYKRTFEKYLRFDENEALFDSWSQHLLTNSCGIRFLWMGVRGQSSCKDAICGCQS